MKGFGGPTQAPAWVTHGLVPLINLGLALLIAGIIIALIGENPLQALRLLVLGAVGYPEAIGYTLYYTTNFVFTGLAVAIAFHCGLFNIGGEGQAYLGGLGAGLIGLYLGHWPAPVVIPLAIACAMAFGAFWAFIPRLAAGEARQPHCHHDDHVQLPGRGADDLSAGRDLHQAGAAGGREPQIRDRRLAPLRPRYLRGPTAGTSAARLST